LGVVRVTINGEVFTRSWPTWRKVVIGNLRSLISERKHSQERHDLARSLTA
jgi:hypothetical protein